MIVSEATLQKLSEIKVGFGFHLWTKWVFGDDFVKCGVYPQILNRTVSKVATLVNNQHTKSRNRNNPIKHWSEGRPGVSPQIGCSNHNIIIYNMKNKSKNINNMSNTW